MALRTGILYLLQKRTVYTPLCFCFIYRIKLSPFKMLDILKTTLLNYCLDLLVRESFLEMKTV